MAIKTIKEESLTALGNAIRAKTGSEDLLEFPNGMIDVIDGFNLIPDEAFRLTGNCNYRFYGGANQWLIDHYGEKIITTDITAESMFQNNRSVTTIPFELNFSSNGTSVSCFNNCSNLKELPICSNLPVGSRLLYGCYNLRSLNGNKFKEYPETTNLSVDEIFLDCRGLKNIGPLFDNIPDIISGNSIFGMHRTFYGCVSLEELINLPFIYPPYAGYGMNETFSNCSRLKNLTFRGGVLTSTKAKADTLNLTINVGYCNAGNVNNLKTYGGFTEDTQVIDDTSYQALKDHPDWWTTDINYSRYNHDSAVNTLNSLPDCSSLNITMTVKFKGASGALTDGGAINTLTEEEIAVATAKGWTVTLV